MAATVASRRWQPRRGVTAVGEHSSHGGWGHSSQGRGSWGSRQRESRRAGLGAGWGWGRGWGYGLYWPWLYGGYGGCGYRYPYYAYNSDYGYPSLYYGSAYPYDGYANNYSSLSYPYPVVGSVAGYGDTVLSQPRVLTPGVSVPGSNGTFPYNGGPASPVPLPRSSNPTPAPIRKPAATVPLDGTLVSAPAAKPATEKFTYPAYGEKRTKLAQPGKDQVADKVSR